MGEAGIVDWFPRRPPPPRLVSLIGMEYGYELILTLPGPKTLQRVIYPS